MSRQHTSPLARTSSTSSCRSRDIIIFRSQQQHAPTNKIQCGLCPRFCVFCEIWKLVTLIRSRMDQKRPSSSCSSTSASSNLYRGSSSAGYRSDAGAETSGQSPTDEYSNEKILDVLFMLKGPRLASMLSLSTLGEVESELARQAARPVPTLRSSKLRSRVGLRDELAEWT